MNDPLNPKAKPLPRESIIFLLDLICKHKIITSKSTSAHVNKLKEEAWQKLSKEFNDFTGDNRRTEQLRLKWENLKKSARKRYVQTHAQIRENNHMTASGKLLIHQDEVLERVASILNSPCDESSAELSDGGNEAAIQDSSEGIEAFNFVQISDLPQTKNEVLADDSNSNSERENNFIQNKKVFKGKNKVHKLHLPPYQRANSDTNQGILNYFKGKYEKIMLKNKTIELTNRSLELENKRIELENEKLALEIRQLKQNMNL